MPPKRRPEYIQCIRRRDSDYALCGRSSAEMRDEPQFTGLDAWFDTVTKLNPKGLIGCPSCLAAVRKALL